MRAAVCIVLAACSAPSLDERVQPLAPDPRFEVRIAETSLGANGHTKREVLVFGTKADGTFSTDDVIVGLDRASAGSLTATKLTLGPHGATTYFTPCDMATAGCTGAAKLTLARASDPGTVIATVDVDLVAPSHVSSVAACAGNEPSVVYLDGIGGDFIRNGMLRVTEFSIGGQFVQLDTQGQFVRLSMTPNKGTQGNGWSLQIDSEKLGVPLAVGKYENAQRSGFSAPNTPGLAVTGNGHGCNTVAGAFEIHDLAISAGSLQRLLVSFEQHCEGNTTKLLEGCFRYAKP